MPKGVPRTKEELEEQRQEIAAVAADLIFRQGFAETSVSQIARAAGMGKSSLYDYFTTKDEIILYFMAKTMDEITGQAQVIIAGEGGTSRRLRRVLHAHLEVFLRDKARILRLSLETQRLSLENQQRYQAMRHAYEDLLVELVRSGIANGSYRAVDPAIAIRTIFAMMSAVILTSRPVGTPQQMLDQGLDLIFQGLEA